MNAGEIAEVLRKHDLWLRHQPDGERADLCGADLCGADLCGADLCGANLRGANLRGANLRGANLCDADLCDADLRGAILRGVTGMCVVTAARMMRCPPEGCFVAWKKCRDGVLVKLLIPEDANRSSGTGYKCRASHVVVLETIGADVGVSMRDSTVTYSPGHTVTCDKWDEDRWNECSGGIHFYMTREEAEAH